jgi:hypothetical protein
MLFILPKTRLCVLSPINKYQPHKPSALGFGFHLIGETVFLLKSLYQLGFVRFFGFYFWIGDIKEKMDLFGQEIELNMVENNGKGFSHWTYYTSTHYSSIGFIKNNRSTLPRIG